jgi:AAA15 family ATPase/GTPase
MEALPRMKKDLPQNLITLEGHKDQYLKTAIIYGANASGKSNLLKAIHVFKDFIRSSHDLSEEDYNEFYDPFLLDESSEGKPTVFNIEFFCEDEYSSNTKHEYEIQYNKEGIISEACYFYPKGVKAKLYERKVNEITFGEYFKKDRSFIAGFIQKSANSKKLLSSVGINVSLDSFQSLKKMFNSFMILLQNETSFDVWEKIAFGFLNRKEYNPVSASFVELKQLFVKALDTGISFIDTNLDSSEPLFRENSANGSIVEIVNKLDIYHAKGDVNHETKTVKFGIERESEGTKSLINISTPLLYALYYGRVLIIDEIESSLHPHVVEFIFNLFNDPIINTKNAQLVATTHNIALLSSGDFRRDQIWITERDDFGASSLYSFADVQGFRKDVSFEKYYNSGVLGGVPVIDDFDFKTKFQEFMNFRR